VTEPPKEHTSKLAAYGVVSAPGAPATLGLHGFRRCIRIGSYQPSVPSQFQMGNGRSFGTSSGVDHR
jgi:hypothetical protein